MSFTPLLIRFYEMKSRTKSKYSFDILEISSDSESNVSPKQESTDSSVEIIDSVYFDEIIEGRNRRKETEEYHIQQSELDKALGLFTKSIQKNYSPEYLEKQKWTKEQIFGNNIKVSNISRPKTPKSSKKRKN